MTLGDVQIKDLPSRKARFETFIPRRGSRSACVLHRTRTVVLLPGLGDGHWLRLDHVKTLRRVRPGAIWWPEGSDLVVIYWNSGAVYLKGAPP